MNENICVTEMDNCPIKFEHADFLTESDYAIFEPHLKQRSFKEKDLLLHEGRTCTDIGYVVKGSFRTYYLSNGKEINTQFVFEEEFVVDYDSFLYRKPSKYFIQALEDCEIYYFSLDALLSAYDLSHNWERFGRLVAEQSFKMTSERVESFQFMDGEQRYLQLMEKEPHLFNRVPLYHIASYLGLERESLSRLRKKIAMQH